MWKKILIGSIIVVTLGASVFIYSKYFTGATASMKRKRRLRFVKKSSSFSNFTPFVSAGNDTVIPIPSLEEAFYGVGYNSSPSQVSMVLNTIDLNYGTYINNIAKITNVKPEIIKSFIFVESNGKADAVSYTGCCFGLMQVSPSTASEVITMEYTKGRLSSPEIAILKKYLPNASFGSKPVVTKADLFKPEFNILVGTLFIGILIDEETYPKVTGIATGNDWLKGTIKESPTWTNYIRMDYVITRYNRGYYLWKGSKIKPKGSPAEVCSSTGSCDYIKKILGTNGTLDLLT